MFIIATAFILKEAFSYTDIFSNENLKPWRVIWKPYLFEICSNLTPMSQTNAKLTAKTETSVEYLLESAVFRYSL